MANTISQNPLVSDDPSLSSLDAEELSDEIRYLGTNNANVLTLVQNSKYTREGKSSGKGLITKRGVKNPRFKMNTRQQRPRKVTVASGTELESSGVTLVSANGILPESTVFNPRNNTSGRIEVIAGAVVTGTHISKSTNSTEFSCAAEDVLIITAPATNETSETSSVYNGTDDQDYNTIQYSRWSVSISWVKQKIKQLAGGDLLTRSEMYLLWDAQDEIERNLIFSNGPDGGATTNLTTGVQTGFTAGFPTNRGLFSLAANEQSAHSAGDIDWMVQQLPEAMGEYTNNNETYIAFCSNEYKGRVIGEQQKNIRVTESGILKEYGIKATDIITSGPTISLVNHEAFNHPVLKNKMLVWAPQDIGYVYIDGHDIQPNNGIQGNKAHFEQNELYSYNGIETKNAGKTITIITDLF